MNRLLSALPTAVITAYMTIGWTAKFRADVMRPLTLALLLIIGTAVFRLSQKDRASAIDKSFVLFIAATAAGFWFWPDGLGPFLGRFSEACLYLILFLAAAGPPLLGGEPFTVHFAKRRTPPAVWETDVFKRINLNMTWAWAGIFAVGTLSALVPGFWAGSEGGVAEVLLRVALPMVLLLGVGLPLTKYYPDYYQRKLGIEPLGVASARQNDEREPAVRIEGQARKDNTNKEVFMTEKRKVVAINGSPHEVAANTSMMIGMMEETLNSEGFDLEQIFLSRHQIHYCYGCAVCLEKGSCWIKDDHKAIANKLLEADAVILGSPVYVFHVTAQMKAFLDRSLGLGHRPREAWKPGLAVCVSAGLGETHVANYLSRVLRIYGAFSVGELTAIAVGPGQFLGKEAVQARAGDLARDLARAVNEGRRYPATCDDREFWQFMGWLVRDNRELMKADHDHWDKMGLYESFEAYVGQTRDPGIGSPEMRQQWIKKLMKSHAEAKRGTVPAAEEARPSAPGTARELLERMPQALKPATADGLSVTYQFEVTGTENFTAHLRIEGGKATFQEGAADKPNVTIKTPADVWLAIASGELDGAQAFMSGKYKVEGDLGLLMKMQSLFKRQGDT